MAFSISAPQTTTLLNPYQYGEAILHLGNADPSGGISKWLIDQGNAIKARKLAEAKEYFKNLDIANITAAKNQGVDILDQYAEANPYFLNKYDPTLLAEKDTRNLAEELDLLNRAKEKFIERANANELNGNDVNQIIADMGYRNRTTSEMRTLNTSAQEILNKRYQDYLRKLAATTRLDNGSPVDAVRAEMNRYGMTQDINQYTSDEYVEPLMGKATYEKLRANLSNLGPNANIDDVNNLNLQMQQYLPYLNPEQKMEVETLLGGKRRALFNASYSTLMREILDKDPNISTTDAFNIVRKELLSRGFTASDFYPTANSELQYRKTYNDSMYDKYKKEVEIASNDLNTLTKQPEIQAFKNIVQGNIPEYYSMAKLGDKANFTYKSPVIQAVMSAIGSDQELYSLINNIGNIEGVSPNAVLESLIIQAYGRDFTWEQLSSKSANEVAQEIRKGAKKYERIISTQKRLEKARYMSSMTEAEQQGNMWGPYGY